MYIYLSVLAGCIHGSFNEVFFERSTCTVGVFVEEEKSLRELAVVESVLAEKTAHNILVLLGLNKCINALAVCLDA